jgi:NAD(P)-dependent dehydrogenase (short-subunit alcohol dehydrogenase family)
MATPFGKTEDGFELQIGTNHLGHFALTMRLIHLMDKVEDPRIVSLSSSMQVLGPMNLKLDDLNWEKRKYSKVGAYSASKLCNVMFASELARKLETTGHGHIRTFSADPGMILTGLQNDRFSQLSMRTLLRPWLKNIPQGASTTMNCATGTNWTESGKFYAHCQTKQPVRIAYDKDAGNKLWAWSEKRTNTIFPFNKE